MKKSSERLFQDDYFNMFHNKIRIKTTHAWLLEQNGILWDGNI